MKRFGPKVK